MAGSIRSEGVDRWPIRVTCVECGFVTDTFECFSEHRSGPPWCAFIDPPETRSRYSSVRTFAKLLVPFLPWRQLTLATPVAERRCVMWTFTCLMASSIVIAGVTAWVAAFSRLYTLLAYWPLRTLSDITGIGSPLSTTEVPFFMGGWASIPVTGLVWSFSCLISMLPLWFSFLFVLFILPVSRKRAKIHGSHLQRIAVISLLPLLVFPLLFPMMILLLNLRSLIPINPMQALFSLHLVGVCYFTCWWYGLVRCYLKLPHASGIIISMLVIGALIQGVVSLRIDGELILKFIWQNLT